MVRLRSLPAAFAASLLLLVLPGPARGEATLVLGAEEFPELFRFYRHVLELPLIAEDLGGGRAVFDASGTRLVLTRYGRDRDKGDAVRLMLAADDLEAARSRLERNRIDHTPLRGPDGAVTGYVFADPEGNPLGYIRATLPVTAWLTPLDADDAPRIRTDSGRVPLMIFGGLFGIWLGVAVPGGLGAEDPEVYGGAMLIGGPLGVFLASEYARSTDMTKGRAGAISLGGSFGTWQGMGWAGSDDDSDVEEILLGGALAGIAGTVAGAVFTDGSRISEGQSTVLTSAVSWGGWYGLVGALVADEDNEVLEPMLVGSAVGLGAGILWIQGNDIAANRARLISLGGVLGVATGFAVDLLVQPDDTETVMLIAGLGGLGGKLVTVAFTADRDDRAALEADGPAVVATVPLTPQRGIDGDLMVTMLDLRFR